MAVPTAKAKSKPKPQLKAKPKVTAQIQTPELVVAEPPSLAPKPLKYHSYADILAAKPHTTILYQSASHTGYIVTSYIAGTFLLGFAGLTCTFFLLH